MLENTKAWTPAGFIDDIPGGEQLNSLSTPRIGVIQLFPILVKKGFSSTAGGFIEPYQVSSGVKLLYN